MTVEEKNFVKGASCVITTTIVGHGISTEVEDAFKACIGTWDNLIQAEVDEYDLDVLRPYFSNEKSK